MFAGKTTQASFRRAALALCLSLLLNVLPPLASAQSPVQKTPGKGAKAGVRQAISQVEPSSVHGKADTVIATATIDVQTITDGGKRSSKRSVKAADSIKTMPEPGKGPDDLGLPSGALNPPPMSQEALAPSAGGGNDRPLVASPAPGTNFQALTDNFQFIPPDTMGAVGPFHVVTALNDRMRIQDRTGTVINTFSTDSFWAPLRTRLGYTTLATFDPKIYYDRLTGRWIYSITANGQTADSALLIAVSQSGDPGAAWNLYGIDTDSGNTLWADYPSIGFNAQWIVVQVNMFTISANAFVRPDIYVFNKAQAVAGTPTVNFTKFTGNGTGAPTAITGSTWAPSLDPNNDSPNKMWFTQSWNPTSGLVRVSTLTGSVGAEVLTSGTQFPQSPESWFSGQVLLLGGWAPQADDTKTAPYTGAYISNNDTRMQNTVFRRTNGIDSLWCTHTVFEPNAHQPAGTNPNSLAHPVNHAGVQWWQIDATLEPGAFTTLPLQRAIIEDTTSNNCHKGDGTLLAGCVPTGTNYAFPNIAVNDIGDALIGYSRFNALDWAGAAYSYRDHTDAPNTFRDPLIFKAGLGRYSKSGNGNVRWGDYSEAQVDPRNDHNFWTIQEYAEARINNNASSVWGTWWANVLPLTAATTLPSQLIISEFRLRGPGGVSDEYVEIYNASGFSQLVQAPDASAGYAVAASDGVIRCTIPNGTLIPSRGHYLCVNSAGYSLASYPAGNGTTATGDATYTTEIPDNTGIALFRTANTANFNTVTRLDAVGSTAETNTLYKEGAGYSPLCLTGLGCTPDTDYAFYRDMSVTGLPKDTNDNGADFRFVDTGRISNGANQGANSRLGAPGPENMSSPVNRGDQIKSTLLDPGASASSSPNRVRDATPVTNGSLGTIEFRRTFVNQTGSPVTRLRFRFVDITTYPQPDAATAELRALSSGDLPAVVITGPNPACPGNTCLVHGTILEEPPLQPFGGGYNSSVSANTVTLATPLAPNDSINFRFVAGVQHTGNYRFLFIIEALP